MQGPSLIILPSSYEEQKASLHFLVNSTIMLQQFYQARSRDARKGVLALSGTR